MSPSPTPRTAGRKKDPQIDRAVLSATLALLEETGYAAITISQVAARVGVYRPAIYRRWPSKQHLVAEAVASALGQEPTPDTGDLRADLLTGVGTLGDAFTSTSLSRVLPALVADLAGHPELRREFLDSVFQPRRASTARRLRTAAERGDIRADFDMEFVLDALAAPLYYRALFGHGPVTPDVTGQSVDLVLAFLTRQSCQDRQDTAR
ncbi:MULTISPECIES: TetR/AcrR family transcriptional regulator [Streptomyces]|uniref:TetR/AcrR family transcriptional regulator n=2 Tax=Streptomyces niveiscabiei TaxID=164115 RepID=A0ABW9HIH0_9ACTN|nr:MULTISPECIES: TetR/AcrR family transcriptional regulator [unclassified Streptomyces]QZZ25001.1 TetR/AcrR family transcriptional regulator [Streptomyces sp. ST1015]